MTITTMNITTTTLLTASAGAYLTFEDANHTALSLTVEPILLDERPGWFVGPAPAQRWSDVPKSWIADPSLLAGYCFDLESSCIELGDNEDPFNQGGMAIFRLTSPGRHDLYLHLYNEHTGIHGHAYCMTSHGTEIMYGVL